jgi:hypothetical protein
VANLLDSSPTAEYFVGRRTTRHGEQTTRLRVRLRNGLGLVSRILRLALLAPEIVEAILAGGTDQVLVSEQLERLLSVSWEEQHRLTGASM